jgi:hypothetical protein
VQPVAALDEWTFDGVGPVTAQTAATIDAHIQSELQG